MLGLGIRDAIKKRVKRVFGQGEAPRPREDLFTRERDARSSAPVEATFQGHVHKHAPGHDHAHDHAVAVEPPAPEHAHDHGHAHAHAHAHVSTPTLTPSFPGHETEGRMLTRENVEDVLENFVRPALQSDGGDIALIDIIGPDVHVRMVGSCADCPSSIATVKMGVERLLMEEFPAMRELVAVA